MSTERYMCHKSVFCVFVSQRVLRFGSKSLMTIALRTYYIRTGLGGLMTQEFQVWYAIKGHPCNAAMGVCMCVCVCVCVCVPLYVLSRACAHACSTNAPIHLADLLWPLRVLLLVSIKRGLY